MGPVNFQVIRVLREALQKGQVILSSPFGDEIGVAAPAIGQQIVDPLNEHSGFSGPCAGQQQQRALRGHGGLALHGIQACQVPGDNGLSGGNIAFFEVSHMFTSFLKSRRLF